MRGLVEDARQTFRDVNIRFSTASDAARAHVTRITSVSERKLSFTAKISGDCLEVSVRQGRIFGPQPYLALKTRCGQYYHDNFDVQVPGKVWTYVFDSQTIPLENIGTIGVASAGRCGHYCVKLLDV